MKSFRFRLLIATLAVLLGSAIAKSQTTSADTPPPPPMHGHGFGRGGPGPMMGFFAKQLNLTDDQQAQMKSVMEKHHTAMKPLMEQSRQIDQQLRQYVTGPYDDGKVRALAMQKAKIETELTVAQTQVHNQLFQLLTPDQQAKAKQLSAEHQARMQQHMNQAPPAPAEQ